MRHGKFAALLVTVGAVFASGSSCIETDIGAPCSLQPRGGDACKDPSAPGCALTRDDLAAGFEKDFVSFGAAECDNLTCVRSRCPHLNASGEADPVKCGELLPDPNDPSAPNGFCSGECINDDDCRNEEIETAYVCRALVLDDEFLNGLKESLSPEEYQRYFGRIQNAKFCAPAN